LKLIDTSDFLAHLDFFPPLIERHFRTTNCRHRITLTLYIKVLKYISVEQKLSRHADFLSVIGPREDKHILLLIIASGSKASNDAGASQRSPFFRCFVYFWNVPSLRQWRNIYEINKTTSALQVNVI
jgi:hypothetical protein